MNTVQFYRCQLRAKWLEAPNLCGLARYAAAVVGCVRHVCGLMCRIIVTAGFVMYGKVLMIKMQCIRRCMMHTHASGMVHGAVRPSM